MNLFKRKWKLKSKIEANAAELNTHRSFSSDWKGGEYICKSPNLTFWVALLSMWSENKTHERKLQEEEMESRKCGN